jgi:halogenation protein CepH
MYGYFKHPGPLDVENPGDILCEAFENGWMWFIPLRDDLASIGVVVSVDVSGDLKDRDAAMKRFIAECPMISERLANSRLVSEEHCASKGCDAPGTCQDQPCHYGKLRIVKDYSYCTSNFHIPGLALVGDSACFIDPVFSSGVHLAQYSALLVARSINTRLAGDLDDDAVFSEFERRYKREYLHFYKFLLGFYDMNQDADSYFWNARKAIGSTGDGIEAFIRLVSGATIDEQTAEDKEAIRLGAGQAIEAYFRDGEKFAMDGAADFAVEYEDRKRMENVNLPLFKGGLVTTEDSLGWRKPKRMEKALSRVMSTEEARRAFHKAKPKLKGIRDRVRGR